MHDRDLGFVEPMQCLAVERLPEGHGWLYEIKLDGYRAIAGRFGNSVLLRSRNDHDLTGRFPMIAKALHTLPDETVVDGEVAVLDSEGRPSFELIQNHKSLKGTLVYFAFDLLVFRGEHLTESPLDERKALLEKRLVPQLIEPLRYMHPVKGSLNDLIRGVKAHRLEGLVAKRRNSKYEPSVRSGAWQKMRVNQGQEFVIGGYTPARENFDALILGFYEGRKLMYAARARNGFTPIVRAQLFRKIKPLEISDCPFRNLPEPNAGRWGAGLTSAKMKECRWLKPILVGQVEFLEWTGDNHLRHSRFIGLRDDKNAKSVKRES
jgi:DNA ligase D-like protein (predicted ligase)